MTFKRCLKTNGPLTFPTVGKRKGMRKREKEKQEKGNEEEREGKEREKGNESDREGKEIKQGNE